MIALRLPYKLFHSLEQIPVMIVLNVALISAFLSPCISGQNTTQNSSRDSAAILLLQKAEDAMGGDAAWSQFGSAQISGNELSNAESGSRAILWVDQWNGSYKFRRESVKEDGSDHRIAIHNAESNQESNADSTSSDNQNSKKARFSSPDFDKYVVMLDHLPAVAFQFVLHDSSYSIASLPPPPGKTSEPCIRVFKLSKSYGGQVNAVTCFSPTTSLPSRTFIQIPNIVDISRPFTEKIEYQSFSQHSAVSLPDAITVHLPGNIKKQQRFLLIKFNPTLGASTFTGLSK